MSGRICFLFAISPLADLGDLPENSRIFDPGNGNGTVLRLPGIGYPDSDLLLRFQGEWMMGDTWLLWLALPCGLDWRMGARAMRFVRRLSMARSTDIQGPWSLRQFVELFPTVSDSIFYQHFYNEFGNDLGKMLDAEFRLLPIISGDDPAALLEADYRVSDEDALADTEPDPATIWEG
jgi:hypothetical protein